MRTIRVVMIGSVLLLGLSSCMQGPDAAAVRKSIEDANAMAAEGYVAGDVEKSLAAYTDDAIVMPPNTTRLEGKDALRAWQNEWKAAGVTITAMKSTTDEVEVFGKLAYETGRYDMTINVGGMGEMKDNGKYISVWKQQADGSWKLYRDIWNTSIPMPVPEPPKETKKKK